jgi:hypothetical protein
VSYDFFTMDAPDAGVRVGESAVPVPFDEAGYLLKNLPPFIIPAPRGACQALKPSAAASIAAPLPPIL